MLLTIDNLKKAKEGDLFEFYFNDITDNSIDAIRDEVLGMSLRILFLTETLLVIKNNILI